MRTVLIGRATTLTVAIDVVPPPAQAVPSGEVIAIAPADTRAQILDKAASVAPSPTAFHHVLTVKHHDGFPLHPTRYNGRSVEESRFGNCVGGQR